MCSNKSFLDAPPPAGKLQALLWKRKRKKTVWRTCQRPQVHPAVHLLALCSTPPLKASIPSCRRNLTFSQNPTLASWGQTSMWFGYLSGYPGKNVPEPADTLRLPLAVGSSLTDRLFWPWLLSRKTRNGPFWPHRKRPSRTQAVVVGSLVHRQEELPEIQNTLPAKK